MSLKVSDFGIATKVFRAEKKNHARGYFSSFTAPEVLQGGRWKN